MAVKGKLKEKVLEFEGGREKRRNEHEKKLNDQVLASGLFLKACELGKIKPTRRQAGKWNRHEGLAFAFAGAAKLELKKEALEAAGKEAPQA